MSLVSGTCTSFASKGKTKSRNHSTSGELLSLLPRESKIRGGGADRMGP